ncbi:DUF1643 domain-containing protein [Paraflavitalea pollutisoli]|uniref:DUF1643 domain-containing protein n=1 Tax=Paraflavitalea pollutisoli TaxID=3034143 RepID=UPI0023EB748D|nr:DUF1643 domain-containing protein [Paraflavitalea sp. H1-2-19X]
MEPTEVKLEGFGAAFSDCRQYRYALWRIWNPDKGLVMFIGLNPSKANETKPDPTITRVIGLAAAWGFGGVAMTNLFGVVSPDPNVLIQHPDPVGDCDRWLPVIAAKCQRVVFAWGAFKQAKHRVDKVIAMFPDAYCLKKTKDGSPWHPLYIPKSNIPFKFKP